MSRYIGDGTATVASASTPGTTYHVNESCPCKDFQRAPHGQCQHKLAYGIATRAT